jgi:hypothetical protein
LQRLKTNSVLRVTKSPIFPRNGFVIAKLIT